MIRMPGRSHRGPLPPLTAAEEVTRDRLRGHVERLAETIGERHSLVPRRLEEAARYVEEALAEAGLPPERLPYEYEGATYVNLAAEIPGHERPGEIVVIGAHYDSAPGCPAANDNASGVAALIELARGLAGTRPGLTVRLVAFTNEEPPFFYTSGMGSRVYARRCRKAGDRIVGMVSLETIGYYSDEEGSQHYPFPLSALYPSRGDFLGFVANLSSRRWLHRWIGEFRRLAPFPSEGASLPSFVTGVGWSDHASFWKEGYPALMITDTAPFRYPWYHTPLDTPEKIDYDRLARVVSGVEKVIRSIAGIDAPR
jgi:hypothetical protein